MRKCSHFLAVLLTLVLKNPAAFYVPTLGAVTKGYKAMAAGLNRYIHIW